ncbi:putative Ig domain-containing protein [Elongatibacter sediminis]|uniref:Ig domain-containing protein n=1 Tax=Elongatibacter sediminis TaxID=3119006 RepID=A0AAW9R972_9GAMM
MLASLAAWGQDIVFVDGFESNQAPVIVSTPPTSAEIDSPYSYDVDASDANGDTLEYSLLQAPSGMDIDSATGEITWTPNEAGEFPVTIEVTDGNDGLDQQSWTITVASGGGPLPVPSDIDDTVATPFADSVEFLHNGPDAIQNDVQEGALEARRVAVARGTVLSRDGAPLGGTRVTALQQDQVGYTLTRSDGSYDLAVNGGGTVVIQFELNGYLTAQRHVELPWNQFRTLDTVRLVPLSSTVTTVNLSPTEAPVAPGDVEADADGQRQGVLLFQPGTTAEMELPDGSTQSLSSLDVRITEYTVGPNGPEAMPAELPPTSGYTYAAEFSVDEAIAAGAVRVHFEPDAVFYVDNFLDFPVGTAVPLGGYDRTAGQWEAAPDGLVLEIVGETDGMADVDLDGDGSPDDPASIGMTDQERTQLAVRYDPGTELWRAAVPHFSPWDCNWPFGPPDGALAPQPGHRPNRGGFVPGRDCPTFNFSRIECQSQIMREDILLAGTTQALHYRSDRAPNHVAGRSLQISIPDEDIPEIATSVRVTLEVAGKKESYTVLATGDVSLSLEWDGFDVYGRRIFGPQPYVVTIAFVYPASYSQASSGGASGGGGGGGGARSFFGQPGVTITGSLAREEIVLSRRYVGTFEGTHPDQAGLGDWSLTDHHTLATQNGSLLLGNGEMRRNADGLQDKIVRELDANRNFQSDETSAVPMPDGSILVGEKDGGDNGQVWRVQPDGTTSLFAGSSNSFASFGDGGLATIARLSSQPDHLTRLADGTVLIGQGSRVRAVDPAGIINTVTGVGSVPIEDNLDYVGPAIELDLGAINDIAAGPAGSYFIAANEVGSISDSIWQVTPDGTAMRIAGAIVGAGLTSGQAAIDAEIYADGIAIAPNGDIWFSDRFGHQVWRISGGIVERVIGSGVCTGDWLDEGLALDTELCQPQALAISSDGNVFVASAFACTQAGCGLNAYTQRLYLFDGERVEIIAGGFNLVEYVPGGFALGNRIGNLVGELHLTADGDLMYKGSTGQENVYLIRPLFGNIDELETPVPSEDGRYVYIFDRAGRHQRTFDTFLSRDVLTFGYDADGRLLSMTDVYGRTTTIARDAGGTATAVIGPDGHQTDLGFTDGELTQLVNPAGDTHTFTYDAAIGAVSAHTDPRGNTSTYEYTDLGRLALATNRGGGTLSLERTLLGLDGYEVAATRRGTDVTTYRLEQDGANLVKTVIDPTGATTVVYRRPDGITEGAFPDGTVATYRRGPDPRHGAIASRVVESHMETPGGISTTASLDVSVTYSDPHDLTSMTQWEETLTRDGRTTTTTYDVATRTKTWVTPEGRTGSIEYDEFGRVLNLNPPGGVAPVTYTYDGAGRVTSITKLNESVSLTYNAAGDLVSATNSEGETTSWTYDPAGRMLSATLPSSRSYSFTLDANGNRAEVTTPKGQIHTMTYDANDRLESYSLPTANPLILDIDGLGRREGLTYPDGTLRDDLFFDSLPTGAVLPDSQLTIGHAPEISGPGSTTQISHLSREPDTAPVQATDYVLDGRLITDMDVTGPAMATVAYTHAYPYRVTARTLNAEPSVAFGYDDDGLITGKGPFTFAREPATGLLDSVSDGTLDLQITLDSRANLASRVLSHSVTEIHDLTLVRDDRTRITSRTETLGGITTERHYSYDADGQLTAVQDGLANPVESFTWDDNGNRLTHTTAGGTENASYDSQDRLVSRAGIVYAYDGNGFLAGRGAEVFEYDADGVLRSATVGGVTVNYTHDFFGRRVARTDAGGTTMYVYGDQHHPFRVTASIAPDTTVSEYLYDDSGVLFAFRRGGAWYYVGTDAVGSPRVVVDAASGATVKVLEYSAFGELLSDTNPAFVLPVGYAGGLSDPVSDLLRFGLRDYEPAAGRFTGRDPLLLAGGTTNFYQYVDNDPINHRDLSGLLIKIGASAYSGLGGGVSVTISPNGIGFCIEGGVGVGGGVGIEQSELSQGGISAVAAVGLGPLGTGIEIPFDECFASGNPTVGWDGFSGTFEDVNDVVDDQIGGVFEQAANEVDDLPGRRGKLARSIANAFPKSVPSPKGLKPKLSGRAEASAFLRGCLPPLTW